MTERVILVLDLTPEEAREVGRRLDDTGFAEFEGLGLYQMVENVLERYGDQPRVHVGLRSPNSLALGGPETPDLATQRE
jgi:hypothetical protein